MDVRAMLVSMFGPRRVLISLAGAAVVSWLSREPFTAILLAGRTFAGRSPLVQAVILTVGTAIALILIAFVLALALAARRRVEGCFMRVARAAFHMFQIRDGQSLFAALLAVGFYWVYVFVVSRMPLIGIPTFRIDYFAATVTYATQPLLNLLLHARPISEIFTYALAKVAVWLLDGQIRYIIYPLQHIALFIYFFSVCRIVQSIFGVRLDVFAVLAGWFLFAGNPGAIEGVYKLETVVGTLSMLFGGFALVSLEKWSGRGRKLWTILFMLCYSLSIFAKEDFVLPPIILLGWYLFRNGAGRQQMRAHRWFLIGVLGLLTWFLVFNQFIVPGRSYMDPVQISGHPYFMTLNPASVATVAAQYVFGVGRLSVWGYSPLVLITNVFYFGVAVAGLISAQLRRQAFLVAVVVGSMMAPYLIMPNHIFTYYGLKWWALEALASVAMIQALFPKRRPVATSLLCAASLLVVMMTRNPRESDYFRSQLAISENVHRTLLMNRRAINTSRQVAVLGVGRRQIENAPWQGNGETEFYLRGDLRLDPQWIVFVESENEAYRIDTNILPGSSAPGRIIVQDVKSLDMWRGIPRLVFAADGSGRLEAVEQ